MLSRLLQFAPLLTDDILQRVQSVQNAAARLVSRTRRRDHITPVLQQLHWLPVRQRVVSVEFKLTLLAYKANNAMLPPHLARDCQLVTAAGHRQHQTFRRLRRHERPRHLSTAASSLLWNRLSPPLWQPDMTYNQFRIQLQSQFFFCWDCSAQRLLYSAAGPHLTYLLTYDLTRQATEINCYRYIIIRTGVTELV